MAPPMFESGGALFRSALAFMLAFQTRHANATAPEWADDVARLRRAAANHGVSGDLALGLAVLDGVGHQAPRHEAGPSGCSPSRRDERDRNGCAADGGGLRGKAHVQPWRLPRNGWAVDARLHPPEGVAGCRFGGAGEPDDLRHSVRCGPLWMPMERSMQRWPGPPINMSMRFELGWRLLGLTPSIGERQ